MKRQETRQYVVQSHYYHKEKLKEEQKERNRKKITLDNIMTKLDKEALEVLETFFKDQGEDGVTLKKFVQFMAETMPIKQAKQFDMMAALCDLFREIDINGDQRLDWDEFIQFIIDHVNARHSKSKTSEILQNLLPRNKVLRFQRKRIVDKFFHTGQITQSFLIRQMGALASIEKGARNIKLFSPDLHSKLKVIDLPSEAGFIIKADYDYKQGLLVGISSNNFFMVWDCVCKRAPQLLYSEEVKPRQINMWHLPKHAGWLTQDEEFTITYWKISRANLLKIHTF